MSEESRSGSNASGASPCYPSSQLAYIGSDGQIFVHHFPSGQSRQLTWSWNDPVPSNADPHQLTYAWPTWSPDGRQLACFAVRSETGQASVYTVAADGVESWERARLGGGMPIYGNWSPQSDVFTVLVQRGEKQLSLETIVLAQPGPTTPLLSGAPLFWSWSPQGGLLAVHTGEDQKNSVAARIVLLEASSGQIVRELSTRPGTFRVPAWSPSGDLLTFVERDAHGTETLRLFDVRSGESAPISVATGMTVALWSPDGQTLAFGSTAHQGSLLFPSLRLLDLSTGQITPLLENPLAGFFWSPHGADLFYLSVDMKQSQLRWYRLDRTTGETTEIVRFLPSREQALLFSFFDQYAYSHPLLAPDGNTLAFAGHLIETAASVPSASPHIYVLPLKPPSTPQAIAPGNLACWDVASRPSSEEIGKKECRR